MSNKNWQKYYRGAPQTLEKLQQIDTVVCAFNANIDSVIKIRGQELEQLIAELKMSAKQALDEEKRRIDTPEDAVRGILRCFRRGIAEEWITESEDMYNWLRARLGLKKLQIGAQAGIIANTLAMTGIKNVIVHNAALPKIQAEQYIRKDNLFSFDESGKLRPVYQIDRQNDRASVHWIAEFDKGESITIDGQTIICPKSNRFIATYDPLLFNLVTDENFVAYTCGHRADYIILSGYQALSSQNDGIFHIKKTIPIIQNWRRQNPKVQIHLEIASTQDVVIRKNIIKYLGALVDSVGINERETIDLLMVLGQKRLAEKCEKNPSAENLLAAAVKLKEKIGCKRLQLHTFGLYITICDRNFAVPARKIRSGMILAAVAAASKAQLGKLEKSEDFLAAQEFKVSAIGLKMLRELSEFAGQKSLLSTGISQYKEYKLVIVPTIIVEKPRSLVGMGDTISSLSLVGAL